MPYPRRVFLVEDNPVMRRSLIAALAPFVELDVVAFANTEDSALQWLAAHGGDIDIVVLDMVLAGGSGLGVLQGMRQRGIRRDVVVLSNHDTPDMRRRCEALGAAAFFDKTQQNEEFLDYLRTMPVSSGVR